MLFELLALSIFSFTKALNSVNAFNSLTISNKTSDDTVCAPRIANLSWNLNPTYSFKRFSIELPYVQIDQASSLELISSSAAKLGTCYAAISDIGHGSTLSCYIGSVPSNSNGELSFSFKFEVDQLNSNTAGREYLHLGMNTINWAGIYASFFISEQPSLNHDDLKKRELIVLTSTYPCEVKPSSSNIPIIPLPKRELNTLAARWDCNCDNFLTHVIRAEGICTSIWTSSLEESSSKVTSIEPTSSESHLSETSCTATEHTGSSSSKSTFSESNSSQTSSSLPESTSVKPTSSIESSSIFEIPSSCSYTVYKTTIDFEEKETSSLICHVSSEPSPSSSKSVPVLPSNELTISSTESISSSSKSVPVLPSNELTKSSTESISSSSKSVPVLPSNESTKSSTESISSSSKSVPVLPSNESTKSSTESIYSSSKSVPVLPSNELTKSSLKLPCSTSTCLSSSEFTRSPPSSSTRSSLSMSTGSGQETCSSESPCLTSEPIRSLNSGSSSPKTSIDKPFESIYTSETLIKTTITKSDTTITTSYLTSVKDSTKTVPCVECAHNTATVTIPGKLPTKQITPPTNIRNSQSDINSNTPPKIKTDIGNPQRTDIPVNTGPSTLVVINPTTTNYNVETLYFHSSKSISTSSTEASSVFTFEGIGSKTLILEPILSAIVLMLVQIVLVII